MADPKPLIDPRPVIYDDITMTINPLDLVGAGVLGIPANIQEFSRLLNKVGDVWSSLKIGWVGTTAAQAQHFNERWQQTMVALFGRADADPTQAPPPGEAVLGQMAVAVTTAGANFAWADHNVVEMFKPFWGDAQPAPAGTSGDQPPTDIQETGTGTT